MNLKIIFLPIFIHVVAAKIPLHSFMNEDEIQSVFFRKSNAMDDLRYKVVKLHHNRIRRSDPTIKLKAFDKDYTLYLEANDLLLGDKTPIFFADCDSLGDKIKFSQTKFELPGVRFYHDKRKRAALMVYEDFAGRINVNGVIDNEIVISSLPTRVHEDVLKNYSSHSNSTYHVIMNSSESAEKINKWTKSFEESLKAEPFINKTFEFSNNSLYSQYNRQDYRPVAKSTKSNLPFQKIMDVSKSVGKIAIGSTSPLKLKVVFAQMLIAIDYETFKYFGNDLKLLSKYMAAFWNAVDLRFREVNDPKIRLNVAGLVVPLKPHCAPYMEKNIVKPEVIEVVKTLHQLSDFFTKNPLQKFVNYDIVVGMSRRNFYDSKDDDDSVLGLSYPNSACKTIPSIGATIISDKGAYSGISVAAHELGHVLGAPHDELKSNDILAVESNNRYLMHPMSGGYHWSKESMLAMQKFVSDDLRKCLRNKPVVGKPYKKILPGRIMSRNEQCKMLTGFEAYTGTRPEFYNCKRLICVEYQESRVLYHKAPSSPAEGSDCNLGGICLNGECVRDPDPTQAKNPPPKPLTRDEQCKKYTGYGSYTGGDRNYTRDCKVLTCAKKSSQDKITLIFAGEPPMEGTECGFGEVCQNQKCIINPEILKGKIPAPKVKSREEQCQKLDASFHTYQESNEIIQPPSSCTELKCEEKNGTKQFIITAGEPPEDGTECGSGKICFGSKCVQYASVFNKPIVSKDLSKIIQ